MRLAIMQPYLFPYLGYFQLVHAVDHFVFFDDVNYINKGWINRNQFLQQNEPFLFTLPLMKASQNRMINEIEISDFPKWRTLFLKQIELNYKKAPFFPGISSWLHDFLYSENFVLVSELAAGSVMSVAHLLGMNTKFSFSSGLQYKNEETQNGQTKILNICELMGADSYVNPKNGVDLYDADRFKEKNISLHFICMDDIVYPQFKSDKFVPYLSMLDVLMFNDIEKTKIHLSQYKLN
jgi:hypothetical protein